MTEKVDPLQAIADLVGKDIAQRVVSGDLTEEEAATCLMELASNPEVQKLAYETFDPTLSELVFLPEKSRLPIVNPLFSAAILERLQFDGDVPEFRGGPLQKDGTPAVPVETEARSPVFLGKALEKASEVTQEEMERRFQKLLPSFEEAMKALPEDGEHIEALVPIPNGDASLEKVRNIHSHPEVDPPWYKKKEKASPIAVREEEVSTLALSKEESQGFAWKALSSTQGRRSALTPIESLVLSKLKGEGLDVQVGPCGEVLCSHEWTSHISGEKEIQPRFSFMDCAASVLAAHLGKELPEQHRSESLVLEVSTVDEISDRQVGWSAALALS